MKKHRYELEICANSVESALAAQEGGAARVEFCQSLEIGGTTPSYAQIMLGRKHLQIGLHVLIRPRGGDFLYSDLEYEEMKADVLYCKTMGCDGVVIGILLADGSVDTKRVSELVALANPMHVTFHRAFDVCRRPLEALEEIIGCGCGRLLTSGQRNTAEAGAVLINELVIKAKNRIVIMPGSGINERNIAWIGSATGATNFHASAKEEVFSKMSYENRAVSGMGEAVWRSSIKNIRQLTDILNSLQ